MSSNHFARSAVNQALLRVTAKPVQVQAAAAPVVAAVANEPILDSVVEVVVEPVEAIPSPDAVAVVDDVVVDPHAVLDSAVVAEVVEAAPAVVEPAAVLDSAVPAEPVVAVDPNAAPVLDDANEEDDPAAIYSETGLAVAAAATIQEWVETDPANLEDGESLADRLLMMFVGIADQDQNGELDEDEIAVMESALDYAWSYLTTKGVSEEDCSALLNDWDDTVAMRVRDLVASALPEGDEAAADEIDDFVFGDDEQGAMFDAVYKKRLVIRDGKKVRINKRVSGTIRLTSAQKVGIRKAQMKSHSATAIMRRQKSLRKNAAMGLSK